MASPSAGTSVAPPASPSVVPEDPESSEEEESESDGEPIVLLLDGREKRHNAGNRMRALLDEEEGAGEVEEMFKDEEGDGEFETKDEEDIFDSDFGSTDSGSGGEDGDDAGEKKLEREAKADRRDARGKKKRATHTPFLPTFARQTKQAAKASRQPTASTSATTLDERPAKRLRGVATVSAGVVRESSRASAVAFKKVVEVRLKESTERRASLPKIVKKATVSLTQADLIDEALQTEEINRASLLAFYAAEEDRRASDRIAGMRYEIVGPKVTFLSRMEGGAPREKGKEREKVGVKEKSAAEKLESGRRRLIEVIGEAGKAGWRPNSGMGDPQGGVAGPSTPASTKKTTEGPLTINTAVTATNDDANMSSPTASASSPVLVSSSTLLPLPSSPLESSPSSQPGYSYPPIPSAPLPNDLAPLPELHSRNYLILSSFEGTRSQEMTAFFGDHTSWNPPKPLPARARALHRKQPTCPFTGLPAPYRDPSTLTPYATIAAFQTLKHVTEQAYAWNETLGAYTGVVGVGIEAEVERVQPKGKRVVVPSVKAGGAPKPSGSGTVPVVKKETKPKEKAVGKEKAPGKSKAKGKGKEVSKDPEKEVVVGGGDNPYGVTYKNGGAGAAARAKKGRESLAAEEKELKRMEVDNAAAAAGVKRAREEEAVIDPQLVAGSSAP